jgi:hypothetical protein
MFETSQEKRSWNTPLREPWNPVIKQCLNAIDYHTAHYIAGKGEWHSRQAQILREYVGNLKQWIRNQEIN